MNTGLHRKGRALPKVQWYGRFDHSEQKRSNLDNIKGNMKIHMCLYEGSNEDCVKNFGSIHKRPFTGQSHRCNGWSGRAIHINTIHVWRIVKLRGIEEVKKKRIVVKSQIWRSCRFAIVRRNSSSNGYCKAKWEEQTRTENYSNGRKRRDVSECGRVFNNRMAEGEQQTLNMAEGQRKGIGQEEYKKLIGD